MFVSGKITISFEADVIDGAYESKEEFLRHMRKVIRGNTTLLDVSWMDWDIEHISEDSAGEQA